jgi:hypothetical protein
MKTIQTILVACAVALVSVGIASAETTSEDESYAASRHSFPGRHGCSLRDVTGKWLFATSIGRQMLPDLPPEKDMTALGTWVVTRDGGFSGTFDVTVEDTLFAQGVPYTGSIVINPDCTGTVTFVTGLGSTRIDTIAVVGRGEILGMSQDPANLWTYQVRRVGFLRR